MQKTNQIRNPLANYRDINEKQVAFLNACIQNPNTPAYKSDGTSVPLNTLDVNAVEFIGGLWRVQDLTNYKIVMVRDRPMILGKEIPHTEHTFFKYYRVSFLTYNCYGPIAPHYEMVVAKYKTDRGTYWSYGKTIADARAFMGIRLYDEYMDLIHSVACKKQIQKN